jgi:hypothetical protein
MTSFNEAFKAARKAKGAGATFTWNGKKYTTDLKDEKSSSKSTPRPKARPATLMGSSKVPNTRTKNETMETVRRNARAITDTGSPARSTKGKKVGYEVWKKLTRQERAAKGYPTSTVGFQNW